MASGVWGLQPAILLISGTAAVGPGGIGWAEFVASWTLGVGRVLMTE